jgi:hypothetical protein
MKTYFLYKKAGTVFVTVAIAIIASVLAGCQKDEVENSVTEKGTLTWDRLDVACEKMFAGEISAFTINRDETMGFIFSSKVLSRNVSSYFISGGASGMSGNARINFSKL